MKKYLLCLMLVVITPHAKAENSVFNQGIEACIENRRDDIPPPLARKICECTAERIRRHYGLKFLADISSNKVPPSQMEEFRVATERFGEQCRVEVIHSNR